MDSINLTALLKFLERPFSHPDSAVYCFCENCQSVSEVSLDTFYELRESEGFQVLDHLDDPVKFAQTYYFTIEICGNCIDRPGLPHVEIDFNEALWTKIMIRRISDLRNFIKQRVPDSQQVPAKFFNGFSAN